jgi:two-component system sensor histidine kinase KdpD
MTRIQSESLRVSKELHSLEEILGSALRRLSDVLRGHHIRPHLPADLPLVPLDGTLIEQVFVNLLENAGKYTPMGSEIEIAVSREDDLVTVEVGDAGPGLKPGDEKRVFEKFYRGDDGGKGVGLGLAICRAIVTAHGGRIWAENRPLGGAAFRFTLPLEGALPAVPVDGPPR